MSKKSIMCPMSFSIWTTRIKKLNEACFASPKEIFDTNAMTKIPVLSDGFLDWIRVAFDYAPNKYRIDLDIGFDDMGGYDEGQLSEIFKKEHPLGVAEIHE